jgi:hypothetical protein
MSKAAAGAAGGTETVKVMVRVRPMNGKEKARGKFAMEMHTECSFFVRTLCYGHEISDIKF